jgi:hypothetical protein
MSNRLRLNPDRTAGKFHRLAVRRDRYVRRLDRSGRHHRRPGDCNTTLALQPIDLNHRQSHRRRPNLVGRSSHETVHNDNHAQRRTNISAKLKNLTTTSYVVVFFYLIMWNFIIAKPKTTSDKKTAPLRRRSF